MMRQSRYLALICAAILFLAGSVALAFLSEEPSTPYRMILALGSAVWWVQLTGVLLLIVGSYGLAWDGHPKLVVCVGVGLILAALVAAVSFGLDVMNVHSWMAVLFIPLFVLSLSGVILGLAGAVRCVRQEQR